MKKIAVLFVLLASAMSAIAESELRVTLLPEQLSGSSNLGAVEIDGIGTVSLTAQKNGSQLVVHAMDPSGTVIGKAESVIGLRDTPIFVVTSNGLEKITIYWGSE